MENIIISCPNQFKEKVVEYHKLFGYQLNSESDLLLNRVKLEFVRKEVNEKVKEVEFKYPLRPFLTFIPLAIGCVLILLLTTLFLVFAMSGNGDRMSNFLYFMVPAFVLLPLLAVYTFLKNSFDNKNIALLTDLNSIKKELGGE